MTDHLSNQLAAYTSFFPIERVKIQQLFTEVQSRSDIFDRKAWPGHITASGIVLVSNRLLMIQHPTLAKWLQPGGHVENDEAPLHTAMREVKEETGISTRPHSWHRLQQFPIDIDIHRIPENERKCEPAHIHYDFRYILSGAESLQPGEHRAQWKEISSVEEEGLMNVLKKLDELRIEAD